MNLDTHTNHRMMNVFAVHLVVDTGVDPRHIDGLQRGRVRITMRTTAACASMTDLQPRCALWRTPYVTRWGGKATLACR